MKRSIYFSMCKIKISYSALIAITAFCGAMMFTGCGDDSSSSAPADEPGGTSSSSVISDDSQTSSSSGVQGAEPAGESSSSVESSSEQTAESAEVSSSSAESSSEQEAESAEQCYSSGMATITLKNMEHVNYSCPNGNTMYDQDTWIYYTCEGNRVVKIQMPPCSNSDASGGSMIINL